MYKKEKPRREHNKKQRLQYQIHHYRMSFIQNQWRKNNSPKYTLSSTPSSVGAIAEIGSNRIFEYLARIIKQQRVRSLRGKVNTEANILISMVNKKAMLWQSCSNLQCKHSFFFFFSFFGGEGGMTIYLCLLEPEVVPAEPLLVSEKAKILMHQKSASNWAGACPNKCQEISCTPPDMAWHIFT